MRKLNKHLTILDLLLISIVIMITLVVLFSFKTSKILFQKNIELKIKVTSTTEIFENINNEEIGVAYVNSVNKPVKVKKIEKEDSNLYSKNLIITVSGPGEILQDKIVFNGARVLIGQKAELHSKFFAQGIIIDAEYEAE